MARGGGRPPAGGRGRRMGAVLALASLVLAWMGVVVTSPPAAAGASRPVVRLAFIGPLSGGNSRIGFGGRNSAQLAILQANENASLRYRYELVLLDDECQPQAGVQAALKAGSDRAIVGAVAHYCSVVALSTAQTFHRLGLPAIVWGAVHPDITYGNDYQEVFRVNGTQVQQNQVAAEFTVRTLGLRRVAALHDTTDYGRGHFRYYSENLTRLGGEVLAVFPVNPDQEDFTAELTRIKALNPEVVWFGGLTPVGVRIRNQMARLGIGAVFQGTSGILNEEFNQALGAQTAAGAIGFLDGLPVEQLPGGRAFTEAYQAAGFREPPEAYGPFAYVAADLFVRAIEAVGPNRRAVTEYLATRIRNVDTIIGPVNFDSYGQNDVPLVTPYVSQDGRWVPWSASDYAAGRRPLPGLRR